MEALLGFAGVAERAGVQAGTVRDYHYKARIRRAAGESRAGDLPPPDGQIGMSPVWRSETVDRWLRARPGRGVGGGRPRRSPSGELA